MAKLATLHVVLLSLMVVARALILKEAVADDAWKERPVTKVVHLLKDMQTQIQQEAGEDEEMFDKLACWCETNDKGKTKAIASANREITELTANIQEYAARVAQLDVDIKQLAKEGAEKTQSLRKSTALREKEQAEFQSQEKDMITSINSLRNAAGTIGKHQTGLTQEALVEVQRTLRGHLESFMQKASGAIGKHRMGSTQKSLAEVQRTLRRNLESFMQIVGHSSNDPEHNSVISLLQQTESVATDTPGFGGISGILKTMKETFESNLSHARIDEKQAKQEYTELRSTKEVEIQASEKQHDAKIVEFAEFKKKLARSKVALKDRRAALKADTETLRNLKVTCQKADREWEQRQSARNEELQAISETIAILTEDESKEVMNRATSFVQIKARAAVSSQREHAASRLEASRRPVLFQAAASVRSAPFDKVVESVEGLVEGLRTTQADEVTKRDWCITELKDNESQATEKDADKDDLQQQLDEVTNTGEQLAEEIASLKAEVLEAQVQMKQASANREKENIDFQETIADQRATQRILTKAVARLQEFYGLLQVKKQQAAPGPASRAASAAAAAPQLQPEAEAMLQEPKKNLGSTGAIAMLETIIQESNEVELDAVKAENEAQAAYEEFLKNSHKNVKVAEDELTNKGQDKGKIDGVQVRVQGDLAHAEDELKTLADYGRRLHFQCDYLVKNFDATQQSRAEEIEALQSARSVFGAM